MSNIQPPSNFTSALGDDVVLGDAAHLLVRFLAGPALSRRQVVHTSGRTVGAAQPAVALIVFDQQASCRAGQVQLVLVDDLRSGHGEVFLDTVPLDHDALGLVVGLRSDLLQSDGPRIFDDLLGDTVSLDVVDGMTIGELAGRTFIVVKDVVFHVDLGRTITHHHRVLGKVMPTGVLGEASEQVETLVRRHIVGDTEHIPHVVVVPDPVGLVGTVAVGVRGEVLVARRHLLEFFHESIVGLESPLVVELVGRVFGEHVQDLLRLGRGLDEDEDVRLDALQDVPVELLEQRDDNLTVRRSRCQSHGHRNVAEDFHLLFLFLGEFGDHSHSPVCWVERIICLISEIVVLTDSDINLWLL